MFWVLCFWIYSSRFVFFIFLKMFLLMLRKSGRRRKLVMLLLMRRMRIRILIFCLVKKIKYFFVLFVKNLLLMMILFFYWKLWMIFMVLLKVLSLWCFYIELRGFRRIGEFLISFFIIKKLLLIMFGRCGCYFKISGFNILLSIILIVVFVWFY